LDPWSTVQFDVVISVISRMCLTFKAETELAVVISVL